jgi:outer membrane protein TolC
MNAIKNIASLRAGRTALALGIGLALSACAVGPNYQRPAAPTAKTYAPTPISQTTPSVPGPGGDAQQLVQGMDIPGQWWTLFHSQPLNGLIDDSIKNNPDLAAAQQALVSAVENVKAQRGAYYPQVSAGVDPTRQKVGDVLSSNPVQPHHGAIEHLLHAGFVGCESPPGGIVGGAG